MEGGALDAHTDPAGLKSKIPAISASIVELLTNLTTPKWEQRGTGGITVEAKDEIRNDLGCSTDTGDVLVIGAWGRVMRRMARLRPSVTRTPGTEGGSIMGESLHEGLSMTSTPRSP